MTGRLAHLAGALEVTPDRILRPLPRRRPRLARQRLGAAQGQVWFKAEAQVRAKTAAIYFIQHALARWQRRQSSLAANGTGPPGATTAAPPLPQPA